MRDKGIEELQAHTIGICKKIEFKSELKIKQKKKCVSGEISSSEEFSTNQLLKVEHYKVLDSIMA